MKISGFVLTALALAYLYLWRTGSLGVVTPAPEVGTLLTPERKLSKAAP